MASKVKKRRAHRRAPIIRTYGVYWSKDAVQWGKAGTKNRMLGSRVRKNRGGVPDVDFWGQAGVYVLYSASFAPVYAGQAKAIGRRLYATGATHGWAPIGSTSRGSA